MRTRLPAERDLAAALGVSRTTVTTAYDRLRDEGYIESRQGAGELDGAAARTHVVRR
ncbi:GntR family transcriptional regulator [Actinomadura madurae]|uniref:GntR family transcriptional regulator n=1 Tax=Actinomadura madurae TaxID=1993 RepID=UPI003FD78C7A